MLLYIMLYIVLAYLMLFAALTNAVCLYNASIFLPLTSANAFYFHPLSLFISFFVSIMQSAFNLFFFLLILCSHRCCFLFKYFFMKRL